MTPKRVIELAGHREVAPWVMKLVMDAVAEEREKQAEQEPIILKFPRQKKNGWTIDWKTISSVEDAIEDNEFKPCPEGVEQVLLALEKVYPATQPVSQDPIAWGVRSTDDFLIFQSESQAQHYATEWEFEVTPLYTAPVRTKDLTDECNLLKDHLSDAKEIIQKLMKERDALVANNKPSAFSVARKRLAKLDQHVRT